MPPGHIDILIKDIAPTLKKVNTKNKSEKEILDLAIRENVIEKVNTLRNLDPVLKNQYKNGEILKLA